MTLEVTLCITGENHPHLHYEHSVGICYDVLHQWGAFHVIRWKRRDGEEYDCDHSQELDTFEEAVKEMLKDVSSLMGNTT